MHKHSKSIYSGLAVVLSCTFSFACLAGCTSASATDDANRQVQTQAQTVTSEFASSSDALASGSQAIAAESSSAVSSDTNVFAASTEFSSISSAVSATSVSDSAAQDILSTDQFGTSGSMSDDVLSSSVIPGSNATSAHEDVTYRDGTYYATAQGKSGDVNVTVVISGGMIVRVTLGQNNETEAMAEKAQSTVIPEILSSQSTDVDVATGATVTSNAIIDAVNQVLERAAE